jgi:hypothetical protein
MNEERKERPFLVWERGLSKQEAGRRAGESNGEAAIAVFPLGGPGEPELVVVSSGFGRRTLAGATRTGPSASLRCAA